MRFDASLHLVLNPDLAAIDAFSALPAARYAEIVDGQARALKRDGFTSGHLWCSDARWVSSAAKVRALARETRRAGLRLSAAVDPRRASAAAEASQPGLDGIVLSPVHAGFGEEVCGKPAWRKLVARLKKLGRPVFVTTAYGTPELYRYDSLRVLARLLEDLGGACPVVALHGGGHRFRELALLADAHPRLSIDLSFTVRYYAGSSLENDWAWGLRKLGPARFLFGSDEPFASRDATLADYERLMKAAGWDAAGRVRVLSGNARTLFAATEVNRV